MVESDFFQKVCRICANEAIGVLIYSDEGKKTCLEEKIKKFLSITVSEQDALPKMVCPPCSSKLSDMDTFATMAIQTQKKLIDSLNSQVQETEKPADRMALWQSQFTGSSADDDDEVILEAVEEEDEQSSTSEDMKGSLLHSILTNGANNVNIGNNSDDITKLEVTLDPMLFLGDPDDDVEPNPRDHSGSDMGTISANSSDDDVIAMSQIAMVAEAKPYQCNLCHRGFNSDLGLQNHMWSHIPFPRKLAPPPPPPDYRFQSGNNLFRHKAYHSGCQCSVCGRVYPTMSTLRAHQITHSNLRPHKCSLCDKTFKRNQDLKFHINQHTGERPYRCPYCPKAFASSGNCFSHRKRMHPKQLARDKNKRLSAQAVAAVK